MVGTRQLDGSPYENQTDQPLNLITQIYSQVSVVEHTGTHEDTTEILKLYGFHTEMLINHSSFLTS